MTRVKQDLQTSGRIEAVIAEIAAEARRNPIFLEKLEGALGLGENRDAPTLTPGQEHGHASPSRPHRRNPGVLDPFKVLSAGGESELRERLSALHLEQLRDIVAEHQMGPTSLVMKWKTPDRVVEHVVATVSQRAKKGDAFRF